MAVLNFKLDTKLMSIHGCDTVTDTVLYACGPGTVYLFELMLYVSVNSNGHVGMLPPFYRTFTQH